MPFLGFPSLRGAQLSCRDAYNCWYTHDYLASIFQNASYYCCDVVLLQTDRRSVDSLLSQNGKRCEIRDPYLCSIPVLN